MRTAIVVTGLVVGGWLICFWLKSPGPALAAGTAQQPQWLYTVYYYSDLMELGEKTTTLNLTKLGKQGWELVAVTPGIRGDKGAEVTTQTTYYFKRPR
jgi:hypothetical protein